MATCRFVAFFDLFLAIHFQKLLRQNRCVRSPKCINYKIEIICWICRQNLIFNDCSCKARMSGGMESNDTSVMVNFPLLCLELQRSIAFFCRFGRDIGEFSSLVLGTACCALAVPFLLCLVWRLRAAGGGGAIRRSSISCRTATLSSQESPWPLAVT